MCMKLDHCSCILHAFHREIEIGHTDDPFRGMAVVIRGVVKVIEMIIRIELLPKTF